MNYAIGYLAGLCDRRGWLRMRDALCCLPFPSGARMDGFDSGAEG